jgi:tetratricopeptide (TPR) repeat protein
MLRLRTLFFESAFLFIFFAFQSVGVTHAGQIRPHDPYRKTFSETTMEAIATPFDPLNSFVIKRVPPGPYAQLWGDYLAGIIALSQHDTLSASQSFKEALAADPNNAGLNERAFVAFLASGDIAQAAQVARKKVFKDDMLPLVLGVQSLKEGSYDEARHAFSSHENLTDSVLSAWAYVGLKQPAKALEIMNTLPVGTMPLKAYHEGLIADQFGETRTAVMQLKSAYEVNRMTLRSADAYARLLSRLDQFDAAATIYEAFEGTPAWSMLAQQALTKLYRREALAPIVSTPQEGAAELFYSLASFSMLQNNDLLALIYLRLALYLNPRHELALVALGSLFEQIRLYDEAIRTYKNVPEDSPFYLSAQVRIAVALESESRSDEAVSTLKGLLAKNPASVEVLTAYGNIMINRKQYAQAIDFYTKAINQLSIWSKSETWNLFYFRGIAYDRNGQWALAEADLTQALLIMPKELPMEQALVLNYLGYSWVERNENLENAFTMIARAARLAPKEGAITDSLGWAFYRMERYPEAVIQLERAAELKPSDWSINDHLGDAYWKVDRKREAVFQWSHARALQPEDQKDLERIESKIKSGLPEEEKGGFFSLSKRIRAFFWDIIF